MNAETDSRHVQQEIDVRQVLTVLDRRKWFIVIFTLSALMTAAVLSFFILPPVYEAQTTLLVVQGDEKKAVRTESNDLESMISAISRLPEMTIKTYVEQIKDPVLLSEVIARLDMAKDGYTVESLSNIIRVTAIKDTNLIEVKVRNTDPKLAVAIGSVLTELFLESISRNTQQQLTKSVAFLQEQFAVVKKDLEAERAKLKDLEARPRSIAFLEQERSSTGNDLNKFRSLYLGSQVAYQQIQAGLKELEKRLKEIPPEEQNQNNPLYVSLKEQVAGKNIALTEERAQMEALSSKMKELQAQLDRLQVELTEKKNETELVRRKVEELEKTYALLSEKITQTQITKSINLGETNIQVVSPSTIKVDPVKPNKKLNLALAGVLGLMMSVVFAFVLELLDNKIHTGEDAERHLELPVLGMIPRFRENGKDNNRAGKDTAYAQGSATSAK
ncbi:MAG: GNVR domain-containing protein [Peptococcaceae bacterium]|jgi:capsular polysaccharide biosynthesis protein|nr:Wzz/FepE/Etk N-terminal domain-containing protein [Peptococcaceae bacterium]MDH7524525.1 GNVR domain-containing protein [Peptococcaceae bacterium]